MKNIKIKLPKRIFLWSLLIAVILPQTVRGQQPTILVVPDNVTSGSNDPMVWTVIASNTSASTLQGAKIRTSLPLPIRPVGWEEFNYVPTTDSNVFGEYSPGNVIEFDLGDMVPGSWNTIRMKTYPESGIAANTAITMYSQLESNSTFNDHQASTVVKESPSRVHLSVSSNRLRKGEVVDVRVHYSYEGVNPAASSMVSVEFPPSMSVHSAATGAIVVSNRISWRLGTLLRGDTGDCWFRLSCNQTSPAGSVQLIRAKLARSGTVTEQAIFPMIAANQGGLTCKTSVSRRQLTSSQTAMWSVEVANQSSLPATNVRLFLGLPSYSASGTDDGIDGTRFSPAPDTDSNIFGEYYSGRAVFYSVGTLNPGARRVFTFQANPRYDTPPGTMFVLNANVDSANGVFGAASQAAASFGTAVAMAPFIQVESPVFRVIRRTNTPAVAFPGTKRGATSARTFTIRNLGPIELNLANVSISGVHAADWKIVKLPARRLTSRESNGMRLVFSPKAPGVRKANLRIVSNDPKKSPFVIPITGLGF